MIREGNWMAGLGGGSQKMPKHFPHGLYAGGPFLAFSTIPCPNTTTSYKCRIAHILSLSLSLSSFFSWTPVIHQKTRIQYTPYIIYHPKDPEMMREAQKMMADPTFQERMKQYTENDAFKQHMEKTKETLQDKDKVKELEEAMKGRIEEGEKELEELKKKSAELEVEEKTKADELKVSGGDRGVVRI